MISAFKLVAREAFRRIAIALPALISAAWTFAAAPAAAYNPYFDDWLGTNPGALPAGGANVSLTGDAACAALNPAGLADVRGFSMSISDSYRILPPAVAAGKRRQIFAGTHFLAVRVAPGVTFATGGGGRVKLGYDWRRATGVGGLPRERFYADERVDALGVSLSPWTKIGAARRSFVHEFERPAPNAEYIERLRRIAKPGEVRSLRNQPSYPGDRNPNRSAAFWRRAGGSETFGFSQAVIPGVRFSMLGDRVKFDYAGGESGRITTNSKGWKVQPAGWLNLYFESETRTGRWVNADGSESETPRRRNISRKFSGFELNLAGIVEITFGMRGGMKSWGAKLICRPLGASYAECKDFASRIAGRPLGKMQDACSAGIAVSLP